MCKIWASSGGNREDSDIEAQDKYSAEFEYLYFKTIVTFEKIIIAADSSILQDEKKNNSYINIPKNVCTNKALHTVKLSSLIVTVFSGSYQELT